MWAWIGLAGIIAILVIAIYYMASPDTIIVKNITVVEKYPYTYRSTPANVIDENGNQYYFNKDQLWAKMRINETYEANIVKPKGIAGKYITAIRIDGMWYY